MSGIAPERCGDMLTIALMAPARICGSVTAPCATRRSTWPGDQIGHGRAGAAIGNEQHFGVGELLQQQPAHLRRRVLVDEFGVAGILLHPGDQRFEIVRRQRLLGDQKLRIVRDQPDRLEIGLQIVIEIVDDAADMGIPLADVDGVAVGRGAREPPDADRAAGAADILDDHRLAEERPHLVGHDAPGDVGRAARRERHDQRDRARGKVPARERERWRPRTTQLAPARGQ